MNKTYTVLKKYGDYKKGETLDPENDDIELSAADIEEAITGGFIKENVAEEDESDKKEETTGPKKKATSVTVTHREGVREFSKEIHGDNFAELAKEFAETNNGTIA